MTAAGPSKILSRRQMLGAAGSMLLPRAAFAADEQATRPAGAFIESVGLCVHLGSEPYHSRFDQFREMIGRIGIRYLREDLDHNNISKWRDLYSAFAIRGHVLVSPVTNTAPELMHYLDAVGPETVAAVEGQNEGDSAWFVANPRSRGNWSETVAAYQRDVFDAVRSRYSATTLPILSPTLLDWKPGDVPLIRDTASFCDMVALHSYVQNAQEPETTEDYAGLRWYIRNFRDSFKPNAPMMVTETGYFNVIQPGGHGISELAAAVYLPRLLLHNYDNGIIRTFLYQFMDGGVDPVDGEHHYGLLRFDGTPKPAYHTVSALLRALDDHDARAGLKSRSMGFELRGAPSDMRRLVFARRDGSLVLAFWRPLRVWDVARGKDMAAVPTSLAIVPDGKISRARCTVLNSPVTHTDIAGVAGAIEVPVSDRVTLVELTPSEV